MIKQFIVLLIFFVLLRLHFVLCLRCWNKNPKHGWDYIRLHQMSKLFCPWQSEPILRRYPACFLLHFFLSRVKVFLFSTPPAVRPTLVRQMDTESLTARQCPCITLGHERYLVRVRSLPAVNVGYMWTWKLKVPDETEVFGLFCSTLLYYLVISLSASFVFS